MAELRPGIPLNLTAAPGDQLNNIAWEPSIPALTTPVSYHVKRSDTSGGPYSVLASVGVNYYQDSGLANGHRYWYVVSAVNINGSLGNSNEAHATPEPVGAHDWQHPNEGYLATGPSDASMAICTESDAPIRILNNKIERHRFMEYGTFRSHPLFTPSVPLSGDQWNDSNNKTFLDYPNHVMQARVGCIYTQLSTTTVANTLVETDLLGTGIGTRILPPNFMLPGKNLRIRVKGFFSQDGAATVRLKVKIGTYTLLSSGLVVVPVTTDGLFFVDIDLTCLSATSIIGQGYTNIPGVALKTLVPVTFDSGLITGQTVSLTAEYSVASAGNTISSTNATIEVLY